MTRATRFAALRVLGPWIRQVHIKDARRTKVPGTWGEEVVVGTGEVDWPAFFATLRQLNFTGDFVIEREDRHPAGGRHPPPPGKWWAGRKSHRLTELHGLNEVGNSGAAPDLRVARR